MLSAIGLTPAAWAAAIGAILFAAVLRGFTGFGFALAAVPLASLVLPPSRTVAAVLLMQIGIGLRDCILEWRQSDRAGIARLTLGALVGLPIGVAALALAPAPIVRAVLGVLVLGAVALTWKPRPAHHRPTSAVTLATGFVSGIFHGLAAMAGPPAVAYYLAFERRLPVMRSSLMVYFPIVSLLGLPMVASAGLLDAAALVLGMLGMPLMLGGGWLGAWAFRRFGARSYRPLAVGALLLTAAASLARAAADLLVEETAMPRRHRVAIVGTGIGARHVEGFLASPDRFEVAVICGRDRARAEALAAQAPGAAVHLGFDDALLARPDLDIVDICLPPDLHLGPATRALQAGKHVILEKPLVASLAEVDALEAAIARTGKILMPIFQARFGNGLAQARHVLASGQAGRIHVATAETHWYRGPAYYATPWRGTIAHELGGAFLTHAIHLHDMLTHLLGPVRSVGAMVATRVNPIETEDTGAVALEMASGALATLSVTLGSPQPSSRLRIVAERVAITSGDAPAVTASGPFTFATPEGADRAWLDTLIAQAPRAAEGFAEQFARFADTLDHGAPLPVTMADARHSLELATAIYHSSRTGQRVALPLPSGHPAYRGWADDLRHPA